MANGPYKKNRSVVRDTNEAGNIVRLRLAAGLTQKQLAAEAGISSVAMVESGERTNTRATTLAAIAGALSRRLGRTVTVDELRARHEPSQAEVDNSLRSFLATPIADGATQEEIELLRAARWGGGMPSPRSWHLLLEAMRDAGLSRK